MVAIPGHLTRILASIQVPNTPIVNASIDLAHKHLPELAYNHVMRTWLNGQAIINKLPHTERATVDEEVFAVASILHDMSWGQDPQFSSPDKRFEVDGANVARSFVQEQGGKDWTKNRQRIVWDAIALHTTPSIGQYKDFEVKLVAAAILSEVGGPEFAKAQFGDFITVTQEEWDAIVKEFPQKGFGGFITEQNVALCRHKPATTYDNSVGDWGEKYLEGYTRVGFRAIDALEKIPGIN